MDAFSPESGLSFEGSRQKNNPVLPVTPEVLGKHITELHQTVTNVANELGDLVLMRRCEALGAAWNRLDLQGQQGFMAQAPMMVNALQSLLLSANNHFREESERVMAAC